MAKLNIGCDFSEEHIITICALVQESIENDYPSRIAGVYGSPREGNPFGSVRPTLRETKTFTKVFSERAMIMQKEGLEVNITFNSIFPHLKKLSIMNNIFDCKQAMEELEYFIYTINEHVDHWIIAHPHLIDLFHNVFSEKYNLKIIASTIMNIHALPQVAWIKENWPKVARICPALWKGRDFGWLRAANELVKLELLTNEFCSIGGVECEGLYRQACYMSQSMDVQNWNPMTARCIESRQKNPESWLMARFILPQWIKVYTELTAVMNYKITGRTHAKQYIDYIGRAYCKENISGNLLELWGQLEATLYKDEWDSEQAKAVGIVNIPIEDIISMVYQFGVCTTDKCGNTCIYCKNKMKKIMEKQSG